MGAVFNRTAFATRLWDHVSLTELAVDSGLHDSDEPPPRRPDGSQAEILNRVGKALRKFKRLEILDYEPARHKGDKGWVGLPIVAPLGRSGEPPKEPRPRAVRRATKGGQESPLGRSPRPHYTSVNELVRGSAGSGQPPAEPPAGLAERLVTLAGLWGPDRPKSDVEDEAGDVAFVVGFAKPAVISAFSAYVDGCISTAQKIRQEPDEDFRLSELLRLTGGTGLGERKTWTQEMKWADRAMRPDTPTGRLAASTGPEGAQAAALECGAVVDRVVDEFLRGFSRRDDYLTHLEEIVSAVEQRANRGDDVEPATMIEEAKAWAERRER